MSLNGRVERIEIKGRKGEFEPGVYAFYCTCGYTKRRVVDSEVFFSCERPIEAKIPACSRIWQLHNLRADLEGREKRKDAELFIATHDEKLAEAHLIVNSSEPEQSKESPTVKIKKRKPRGGH